MNHFNFPLNLNFKITTIANDFVVTDANGVMIAYVKQKMFKFIESVTVFNDDSESAVRYHIKANQWIDFSTSYFFTNPNGLQLGHVARKGWVSLWKSRYEVYNEQAQPTFLIEEENAWVKVLDGLFSEIPILGILTGYIFNPSYIVVRPDGTTVARLKKEASFLGRKFTIHRLAPLNIKEEERIVLSLMMMVLLERSRG